MKYHINKKIRLIDAHTLNNINREQKLSTYNNHSIGKCRRFGAIFQGPNLHKVVFSTLVKIYERGKTST